MNTRRSGLNNWDFSGWYKNGFFLACMIIVTRLNGPHAKVFLGKWRKFRFNGRLYLPKKSIWISSNNYEKLSTVILDILHTSCKKNDVLVPTVSEILGFKHKQFYVINLHFCRFASSRIFCFLFWFFGKKGELLNKPYVVMGILKCILLAIWLNDWISSYWNMIRETSKYTADIFSKLPDLIQMDFLGK